MNRLRIPLPTAARVVTPIVVLTLFACDSEGDVVDPDQLDAASDTISDVGTRGTDAPIDTSTDVPDDVEVDVPGPGFSEEAFTFSAEFGAGDGQVCLDLDTRAEVECAEEANTWDVMFEVSGRIYAIWTNGGVHGHGAGAAFGVMDPDFAATIRSASDIPGWFTDSTGGVILDQPWQTYNVHGTHDVTANYRVYAADTGAAAYKFQIRSYYGAAGETARLQLRYAAMDGTDLVNIEVNASAGGFGAPPDNPANRFAYLDLDTGTLLDISDEEASTNTEWDLGFKRFTVIANGGSSGPGTVETAFAAEIDGLYDDNGLADADAFSAVTDAEIDAVFESVTSTDGLSFTADQAEPWITNDGGPDSWFQFEFGPAGPEFLANADSWWAIRGAEWLTFAKMHVTEVIREGDSRTFIAEFYIQDPADE